MPAPEGDGRRAQSGDRLSSRSHAEQAGRTIAGRYRLDRILGTGSMGTVWAASDEVLRRRVAIKEIYLPAGAGHHEAALLRERTLREARAIAALSHPNVITLYDILTLPSGPVIVMEMLAARSLGEVLKEVGPLTIGQAATVGLAVASGLSAAHAAGITHRDVKPGNVLIGGDGRIKLTDFGIARSADENPLTATGLLLGSPAYIAPEVASGETAGPPADAWGLGALLFACVEGMPPYDRGSPVATLMAVVSDPVPVPEHAGPLTPLIRGLMVKEPIQRLNLRQARAGLRPLADDPVETRLVFPPSGVDASAPARAVIGGPPRPVDPARPPWVDEAPPRTDRPNGTRSPAPAGTRPGMTPTGRGVAGPAAAARATGTPPGAGSVRRDPVIPGYRPSNGTAGTHRPPLGDPAGMPPPPWADQGAAGLAALPTSAPRAAAGPTATAVDLRVPLRPSRSTRRWIAVLVFLLGIAVAYFGIRAIAATVSPTASAPVGSATAAVLVEGLPSGPAGAAGR